MPEILFCIGAYPPPLGGAELGQQMLTHGLARDTRQVIVQPVVVGPQPPFASTNPLILPALVTPYPLLARDILRAGGSLRALEERNPGIAQSPEEFRGAQLMLEHSGLVQASYQTHNTGLTIISPLWHTRDVHVPSSDNKLLGIARGHDVRTLQPEHTVEVAAINQCDHVICISPSLKANLEHVGVTVPMSVIIPAVKPELRVPPIGPDRKAQLQQQLHIPENSVVFGHVSTHQPFKRVPDIVDGFAKLLQITQEPVHLLIVGEGPQTPEAKKLVEKYGIGSKVSFAGSQPNAVVYQYYDLMDCFVFASTSEEGLGRVVLESQVRELPIILSNVPGPTDVVDIGLNALVFSQGDTDHLARVMNEFASNGLLRQKLTHYAAESGRQQPDTAAWLDKHEKVLYELQH